MPHLFGSREGLEKMEREKLKEADRLRETKQRDEKQKQQRLAEQKILELTGALETPILKSKFVSTANSVFIPESKSSEYSLGKRF